MDKETYNKAKELQEQIKLNKNKLEEIEYLHNPIKLGTNETDCTKLVVKFKGDNSNRIINISRNEMDGILEYLKEKLKSNIKNAENEFESL